MIKNKKKKKFGFEILFSDSSKLKYNGRSYPSTSPKTAPHACNFGCNADTRNFRPVRYNDIPYVGYFNEYCFPKTIILFKFESINQSLPGISRRRSFKNRLFVCKRIKRRISIDHVLNSVFPV
jgi:hypothetical protein